MLIAGLPRQGLTRNRTGGGNREMDRFVTKKEKPTLGAAFLF
jgi:hypothetical protein